MEANYDPVQMIKKIAVIGPESSGKTTLSQQLSEHFNEPMAVEFARQYLNSLNRSYTLNDLIEITKGQIAREEEALEQANKMIICDTEMMVMYLWALEKFGKCPPYIEEQSQARKYDWYLLCRPDIPWEYDPMRENPDRGDYFFNKFESLLRSKKANYTIIEGSREERFQKSVETVVELGIRN